MVVTSTPLAVGSTTQALGAAAEPVGDGGAALIRSFERLADDLGQWTNSARSQRVHTPPPY